MSKIIEHTSNGLEWNPIPGFEGFKIRIDGQVISATNGKLLKPFISPYGYWQVRLTQNRKTVTKRLHRLLALVFIPNPENKETVNHINGDKTDNRIENLEWNTFSENSIHAHKNGLVGTKKIDRVYKPCAKKDKNGKILFVYPSLKNASVKTGIRLTEISKACLRYKRRNFTHERAGGFYWDFISRDEYKSLLSSHGLNPETTLILKSTAI